MNQVFQFEFRWSPGSPHSDRCYVVAPTRAKARAVFAQSMLEEGYARSFLDCLRCIVRCRLASLPFHPTLLELHSGTYAPEYIEALR